MEQNTMQDSVSYYSRKVQSCLCFHLEYTTNTEHINQQGPHICGSVIQSTPIQVGIMWNRIGLQKIHMREHVEALPSGRIITSHSIRQQCNLSFGDESPDLLTKCVFRNHMNVPSISVKKGIFKSDSALRCKP